MPVVRVGRPQHDCGAIEMCVADLEPGGGTDGGAGGIDDAVGLALRHQLRWQGAEVSRGQGGAGVAAPGGVPTHCAGPNAWGFAADLMSNQVSARMVAFG